MTNPITILGITTLIILIILLSSDNKTIALPQQQVDHEYELDTWGTDVDVYEFTPRPNPDISCIIVSSSIALECFNKKEVSNTQ